MKRRVVLLAFALALPSAASAASWSIRHNFELKEYQEKKEAAEDYLNKVSKEMRSIPDLLLDNLSPETGAIIVAKAKILRDLAEWSYDTFPAFRPLSSCRGVAGGASRLFQNWLDGSRPSTHFQASIDYAEALRGCQAEIDIPPSETITVTGPASKSKDLPEECLLVVDVTGREPPDIKTFTCPASVEKDL